MAGSQPAAAAAEPVFVTCERRKRSPREFLPRLTALLAVAAAVGFFSPVPLHPGWLLLVGLLAVPLCLRLRPRRLEIYPDHLLLGRGGRRERISLIELTGLGVRPGAPVGGATWDEVVRLRTITTQLDLAALEDGPGAWKALARHVLPVLVGTFVERLEKGKELDLGAVRGTAAGVIVEGRTIPWDRLGDVTLEPDGVLLQVRGRPDLSALLPARLAPGAPLLPWIRESWLPRRGGGEDTGPLDAPVSTRRFPVVHPELGALLFPRLRPPRPGGVKKLLAAACLALLAGGAGLTRGWPVPGGLPSAMWLSPGALLALLALVVGRVLGRPRGSEFAAYENGLMVAGGAIPWDGVRTLTLATTREGGAAGGRYRVSRVTVEGEHLTGDFVLAGGIGQAYAAWFRQDLGARMARQALMRVQAGESVPYAYATVVRTGLLVEDQEVTWEEIVGVAEEAGATQVVRRGDQGSALLAVPAGSPNAVVFTRVVQTLLAELARSDAETSAIAEAAALAAAAAVVGAAE